MQLLKLTVLFLLHQAQKLFQEEVVTYFYPLTERCVLTSDRFVMADGTGKSFQVCGIDTFPIFPGQYFHP